MYTADKIAYNGNDSYIRMYQGDTLLWEKSSSEYNLRVYLSGGTYEDYYYSDGVIPAYEFSGRTDIVGIYVGSGITTIGQNNGDSIVSSGYSFYKCSALSSVTFEEGSQLNFIAIFSFSECSSLQNITIPNTVKTLHGYTFSGCTSLSSITFEEGSQLTHLGGEDFAYCINLKSIEIPKGVETLYGYTFFRCYALSSITFEEGSQLTYIQPLSSPFKYCTALQSIEIPKGVEYLYAETFSGCSSLSAVTFEEGSQLTCIGGKAFANCTALQSIELPASLTAITGENVFSGCTNLAFIKCYGTTAPTFYYYTFYGVARNGTLSYPAGSDYSSWLNTDEYYLGYYGWSGHSFNLKVYLNNGGYEGYYYSDGKIPAEAFSSRTDIVGIEIGNGITGMSYDVFADCSSLSSITFEEGSQLTHFGRGAFANCTALTSLEIPASVRNVYALAFSGCTSLTAVTFEDNSQLNQIWDGAFRNCTALTEIELPSSIEEISSGAFSQCSSLNKIISNSDYAPTIDYYTFYGVATGGTLYYPSGSDYSTWLSTEIYYLGYYGWSGSEI